MRVSTVPSVLLLACTTGEPLDELDGGELDGSATIVDSATPADLDAGDASAACPACNVDMDGTASRPDAASLPTDAGSSRQCTSALLCPRVECENGASAFPKPVRVQGTAASAREPLEELRWRLANRPSGSTVMLNPGSVSAFDFVPDVEGDYVWCLTAVTRLHDTPDRCCTYRYEADGPLLQVA